MTGFIGVGQLRYILTNLGEKMTDEEVDELLKAVDTSGNGEVNYTGMFLCSAPNQALHHTTLTVVLEKNGVLVSFCGRIELTEETRSRPHDPRQLDTKHHTFRTIMRSKENPYENTNL